MLREAGHTVVHKEALADVVVACGGTLLDTLAQPGVGPRVARIAALSKPYALFGLGVAREPKRKGVRETVASRKLLRHVCERACYVGVRDQSSRQHLTAVGFGNAHVTCDPTVMLRSWVDRLELTSQLVGVSLAKYHPAVLTLFRGKEEDRNIAGINKLRRRLGGKWQWRGLIFNSVDHPLLRRMRIVGRRDGMPSPLEMAGLVRQCEFVIGERMHSCLLAAAMGTPFLALLYKKVMVGTLKDLPPVPALNVVGLRSADLFARWDELLVRAEVLKEDLNTWAEGAQRHFEHEFVTMLKALI